MSSNHEIRTSLKKAASLENRNKWFEAAKEYEKASKSQPTSNSTAETWERVGFCYSRASMQTTEVSEFKTRLLNSIAAYEKAAEIFSKNEDAENKARASQAAALATYWKAWMAPTPEEKRKLLEESSNLINTSLANYERLKDTISFGRACTDLLRISLDRQYIASNWKEQEKIAQEGLKAAEKALTSLAETSEKHDLLRAYSAASLQSTYAANVSDQEEREKLTQKSLEYSKKAVELSKDESDHYNIALAHWAASFSVIFTDVQAALQYAREMLKHSELIEDNYFKGVANYILAFATKWAALKEADPDKRREGLEKIITLSEEAIRHLEFVAHDLFIAETYSFYADTYSSPDRTIDKSPEEKLSILKTGLELGRKGLKHASRSGSLDAEGATLHALSKALFSYSKTETEVNERKKLLAESLAYRKGYNNIVEKAFKFDNWLRGVGKYYEGLIKSELAELEPQESKSVSLQEAISNMEEGVSCCLASITQRPIPARDATCGEFENRLGRNLDKLFELTKDEEILIKAIDTFKEAAETLDKADQPSRAAECYWKRARDQERIGKYQQAADSFDHASRFYKSSAQKMPNLKDFFTKHTIYMQAWSEIEKARHFHRAQQYNQAKKHYEKTASLHEDSKTWQYLAPNYSAWAQLEYGEDLSRQEQSQKSVEAFQQASTLFLTAKRALEVKSFKLEDPDEKELVNRLIKASDIRRGYCQGRIVLEEAKMHDQQGEHAASSKKYLSAAEKFEETTDLLENEVDRQELKPLISLCKAWQMMTQAEAEAQPDFYLKAAELFDQAKEESSNEKARLLALGHSSFCRALEAGTKFEATRNPEQHQIAARQLESAANYYVRAGFKAAFEYAKATQRLFDAYTYMDSGKRETDPDKKTRYYMMAERVLRISSESYQTAKHPEKSTQIQRLLERVREERELAASLSEVLHAPTITSSTASFATPTSIEESAVGLESFEHVNIQANMVLAGGEIGFGEEFDVDFQIGNVGRETVLLTRVERFPPTGFMIAAKPSYCSLTDTHIDMRGKRLEPLQTENIRITLRSFDEGSFDITPKLVYVDEAGRQTASELDPETIKVSKTVLPDRVSTGYTDLDNLLLGGIPQDYATLLTSPSCDEKDLLTRRFIEEGVKTGQATFYITTQASGIDKLIREFQSTLYLFLCNPRAETLVEDLPNVFKLQGTENLNQLNIALTSAFRKLDPSPKEPRRICIEIVSDILLQHHAVTTRRWLTALLPELKSNGFTTLAVMNPEMHSSEEVQAVLGLFEGEIALQISESTTGLLKRLKIQKLRNQKYLQTELPIRKERLQM